MREKGERASMSQQIHTVSIFRTRYERESQRSKIYMQLWESVLWLNFTTVSCFWSELKLWLKEGNGFFGVLTQKIWHKSTEFKQNKFRPTKSILFLLRYCFSFFLHIPGIVQTKCIGLYWSSHSFWHRRAHGRKWPTQSGLLRNLRGFGLKCHLNQWPASRVHSSAKTLLSIAWTVSHCSPIRLNPPFFFLFSPPSPTVNGFFTVGGTAEGNRLCERCDKEGCFEVCFPALIIHLLKPPLEGGRALFWRHTLVWSLTAKKGGYWMLKNFF